MMLRALHANDVVPAAQMKKSKSHDLDFLAERVGFEPTIPFNQKLRRIICYCSDIRTTLASSF